MKRPKLKTNCDMAQYIADLEVELAWEQKQHEETKAALDAALDALVDDREALVLLGDQFMIPHPGTIC